MSIWVQKKKPSCFQIWKGYKIVRSTNFWETELKWKILPTIPNSIIMCDSLCQLILFTKKAKNKTKIFFTPLLIVSFILIILIIIIINCYCIKNWLKQKDILPN